MNTNRLLAVFAILLVRATYAIAQAASSSPSPTCLFSSFYKSSLSWESGLAEGIGPATPANGGDLVGRVIAARDGEGMPGARVVVRPANRVAITDSGGRFAIRALKQGRYLITVLSSLESGARSASDSVTVGFDGLRIVAALSTHRGDIVCTSSHVGPPPFPPVASVASAQTGSPERVTVSTVLLGRDMARLGDTASGVVFVVRDLFSPARPLEGARIAVGPPATDVRRYASRSVGSDNNGTARLLGFEGDTLDVIVFRIGYGEVRFALRLARGCRETIEVYMRSSAIVDGEVSNVPTASPRVVRTTCAPPS